MLLTENIEISITSRNYNHYKALGYDIPMKYNEQFHRDVIDIGKKIMVKTTDLPKSSHLRIKYRCDCCGEIFETDYHSWANAKYPKLGDLCKSCALKVKLPKSIKDKYGVDNVANAPSIIEKKKKTNLEKYGTEWAITSKQVRDKIIETNLDRYGVENAMSNEAVKQKAIQTNNSRYGGNCSMCDSTIRQKSIETCLEKYGVPNAFQCKEIQAKARQTLYGNGTVPSSKAEKEMCKILIEMFGAKNCFPNYPYGNLSLDCLVLLDGVKIDFEYDGAYWHKDRAQHDAARNAVLIDDGYKIIRIKANNKDDLPSVEQIKNAVDYLVKDNHHLVFIDMNK